MALVATIFFLKYSPRLFLCSHFPKRGAIFMYPLLLYSISGNHFDHLTHFPHNNWSTHFHHITPTLPTITINLLHLLLFPPFPYTPTHHSSKQESTINGYIKIKKKEGVFHQNKFHFRNKAFYNINALLNASSTKARA